MNVKRSIHYAQHHITKGEEHVNTEHKAVLARRFEDLTTLLLAAVVGSPIALGVGIYLNDWVLYALGFGLLGGCGVGSMYLLRVIREQTIGD